MGQTCISPDYVMLTSEAAEATFIAALKAAVLEFFGAAPRDSADISRIVNERHTERLGALLRDGAGVTEVVCGGADSVDVEARYIAPTVLRCAPDFSAKCFEEEVGACGNAISHAALDWPF